MTEELFALLERTQRRVSDAQGEAFEAIRDCHAARTSRDKALKALRRLHDVVRTMRHPFLTSALDEAARVLETESPYYLRPR